MTQKPVEALSNGVEIVVIGDHRELKPGRWEASPQLLVSVSMWRNGGTAYGNTHICDGCLAVGLRAAKKWVDQALADIEPPNAPAQGREPHSGEASPGATGSTANLRRTTCR